MRGHGFAAQRGGPVKSRESCGSCSAESSDERQNSWCCSFILQVSTSMRLPGAWELANPLVRISMRTASAVFCPKNMEHAYIDRDL